jgi:hypothetical protein
MRNLLKTTGYPVLLIRLTIGLIFLSEGLKMFPAFRKIVSNHEFDSLGEEFEENEHELFGTDGFETMVTKVADIEKSSGIYELSQFTSQIKTTIL